MRKQFNLQDWLKDKSQKVETRDGRPVKIISFEMTDTNDCPIAAQFRLCAGTPVVYLFDKEGHYKGEGDSNYDLLIVTPEEELTEFEQEVSDIVEYCKKNGENVVKGYAKRHAKSLLFLAREQLIKEGYVIEKKAFYDAVKKVDPKVIKEVSEKWDAMKEALRLEYERGKADALKDIPKWRKFAPNINDILSEQRICNELENSVLRVDVGGYCWVISREDLNKLPKED